MSVTRLICKGCGYPQAWCTCGDPDKVPQYAFGPDYDGKPQWVILLNRPEKIVG